MMSIHIPKHNVLMYIEISEIEWLDLYIFKRHLVNRVYSTYITKIDPGMGAIGPGGLSNVSPPLAAVITRGAGQGLGQRRG